MNGDDGMNYLDKQLKEAYVNYNYFFVKLIFSIFKIIVWLAFMLLISSIFNYTIINIMVLIYTFYALYSIYDIWKYYTIIITDIKETLKLDNLSLEIDTNLLNINFFKGVVKYGK